MLAPYHCFARRSTLIRKNRKDHIKTSTVHGVVFAVLFRRRRARFALRASISPAVHHLLHGEPRSPSAAFVARLFASLRHDRAAHRGRAEGDEEGSEQQHERNARCAVGEDQFAQTPGIEPEQAATNSIAAQAPIARLMASRRNSGMRRSERVDGGCWRLGMAMTFPSRRRRGARGLLSLHHGLPQRRDALLRLRRDQAMALIVEAAEPHGSVLLHLG